MGLTPVENYYIDSGWGTWGFKATPVCGTSMAELIATGRMPELIKEFRLDVSATSRSWARRARPRSGIRGRGGAAMKIMPCPLNGPRNIQEFICAGPVEPQPDPNRCSDDEWTEYV